MQKYILPVWIKNPLPLSALGAMLLILPVHRAAVAAPTVAAEMNREIHSPSAGVRGGAGRVRVTIWRPAAGGSKIEPLLVAKKGYEFFGDALLIRLHPSLPVRDPRV